MTTPQLKSNFAVANKHEAFYTGGKVQFSSDGCHMFCQCGRILHVMDVESGQKTSTIGEEEDPVVTSFTLSPDDQILVVANQNLLLTQWNWREELVTRTWKAIHSGPVSCMTFDPTSTLLATGGSDSTLKVWDVGKQYCTHNLRGHTGVISVVAFHPDIGRLQLLSAADDYKVRVWCLQSSTCIATLEAHYSRITAFQFSPEGSTLYTGGRDNIVAVWNTDNWNKHRIVPVYESLEDLVLLPEGKYSQIGVTSEDPHFITAGSKGVLRVWNAKTSQCVYTQPGGSTETSTANSEAKSSMMITAATYHKSLGTINVITSDHYINLYKVEDLAVHKQLIGFNDDILAVVFLGAEDSHLAVATNSSLIKVFQVASWSCQVLEGHTDIVLSLAVSQCRTLLASASKDNSMRIWKMDTDTLRMRCVALATGHTHAVNSLSFSKLKNDLIVTGSEDCTMKVWPLPEDFNGSEVGTLHSQVTEHAHNKEIMTIMVAPNDKLVASGSQDHTAKLWTADHLSLLGVFRGHRRAVWTVQFSPVDQCLATSSADATIKIWALSDHSCVKTFEGHNSSVLQINFVTRGMQLLSSGADGLLKLWTIKTNECVGSWDEHEDKVWAMAVNAKEDVVVTGAGDSVICLWKDVTQEEQLEARKQQEDFLLQEQELLNLLQGRKFVKAIVLGITLNQPFRVLNIMKDILVEEGGQEELRTTLMKLREDQLGSVLQFASQWNTNSRNCHVAQFVLNVALTTHTPDQLLALPNIRASLEALLPYTERHFQRMNRLQHSSTFVEYTWQCMKLSPGDQLETSQTDEPEISAGFVVERSPHEDLLGGSTASSDDSVPDSSDEESSDMMETEEFIAKDSVTKDNTQTELLSDKENSPAPLVKKKTMPIKSLKRSKSQETSFHATKQRST